MPTRAPEAPAIFVVRQAGSASGLLPVARALEQRGVPTRMFAYEHSVAFCRAAGITPIEIAGFDDAAPHLPEHARALVTGTSLEVDDDARFWRWARERGVPSLGFIDSWVNYGDRFERGGRAFAEITDAVAVIDDRAAKAMRDLGCPAPIVTLGHPAFDGLAELLDRGGADRPEARAVRQELAGAGEEDLVVFVSEPIAAVAAASAERDPGYREGEVVAALIASLDALGRARGRGFVLAAKLHPRERALADTPTARALQPTPHVRVVVSDHDRYDLVLAADLVTGMTSMLLHEAALMGRPVVAIQPKRRLPSPVTDEVRGIRTVTDAASLGEALRAAIAGSATVSARLPHAVDAYVRHILGAARPAR